jgi:acyl-CoA thioesterase YciA
MSDDGPKGELAIRTLAMPENTNPDGHIFGGWVVSQMDLAGLYVARSHTRGRCVTVAINSMTFIAPVHVGDFVCCYSTIEKLGHTSMHIRIETWAFSSRVDSQRRKVTEGVFVFVAVDENNKPQALIKSE